MMEYRSAIKNVFKENVVTHTNDCDIMLDEKVACKTLWKWCIIFEK